MLHRRHKKISIYNCTNVIIAQAICINILIKTCIYSEHEPSVNVHASPTFLFLWQNKSLHSQAYFICKTEREKTLQSK